MDGFVWLVVLSGIEIIVMRFEEKVKVYYMFFILNECMNFFKFMFSGMNDEVIFRVDLDEKSFGKDEFNDVLIVFFVGMNVLMDFFGLIQEFQEIVFERFVFMVFERMQNGVSEREIIEFFMKKVGMSKEDVEVFLVEFKKVVREDERGYI